MRVKACTRAALGLVPLIVGAGFACAGHFDAPLRSEPLESLELARLRARDRTLVIRSTAGGVTYDLLTNGRTMAGLTLAELRVLEPELSVLVEYGYARSVRPNQLGEPYLDASGGPRSLDEVSGARRGKSNLLVPAAPGVRYGGGLRQ